MNNFEYTVMSVLVVYRIFLILYNVQNQLVRSLCKREIINSFICQRNNLVLTDESRILSSTTTMDSMGRFESQSPTMGAPSTPSEIADFEKTITNLLPSQDTITSLVASSNRASASFLRKHVNQVRFIQALL